MRVKDALGRNSDNFFRDKFRMSCKTRNGDGDAFLHFRRKNPQTGEWMISGAEDVMICFGNHHFHIVAVWFLTFVVYHILWRATRIPFSGMWRKSRSSKPTPIQIFGRSCAMFASLISVDQRCSHIMVVGWLGCFWWWVCGRQKSIDK